VFPRPLQLAVVFSPFRLWSFFIEFFHVAEFFAGEKDPRLGGRVFVFGPVRLDAFHVGRDEVYVGRHLVTGSRHLSIRIREFDLRPLKEALVQLVAIGIEAVHHFLLCTLNQLVRGLLFLTHDTSAFYSGTTTPELAFSRGGGETLVIIWRMI